MTFFYLISKWWGSFSHCDEITQTNLKLDVARICIRTSFKGSISKTFSSLIDGKFFEISLMEDPCSACVPTARSNSEEDDDFSDSG